MKIVPVNIKNHFKEIVSLEDECFGSNRTEIDSKDISYGIFDNGKLIANILFYHNLKTKDEKYIFINCICVRKKYRRKGLATKLLNFVFDIIKEKNYYCCLLEMRNNNLIAKKLYEKEGFKIYNFDDKWCCYAKYK